MTFFPLGYAADSVRHDGFVLAANIVYANAPDDFLIVRYADCFVHQPFLYPGLFY